MKVYITKNEWYPVFGLTEKTWYSSPLHKGVDISEELFTRYNNALNEFEEVQSILEQLHADSLNRQ